MLSRRALSSGRLAALVLRQAQDALSLSSLDIARDDPEELEGSKGGATLDFHHGLLDAISAGGAGQKRLLGRGRVAQRPRRVPRGRRARDQRKQNESGSGRQSLERKEHRAGPGIVPVGG